MPCAVACSRADDDRPVDVELEPQQRGRPLARRALRHLRPARPRTPASPRPRAARSRTRPAPTPGSRPGRSRRCTRHSTRCDGRQRRPGVGHQQALVAVDPAGVPAVVGGDPVGLLLAGAVRAAARTAAARSSGCRAARRGAPPAGEWGAALTGRPWSRRGGRRALRADRQRHGRRARRPSRHRVPVPQGAGVRPRPAPRRSRPARR